MRLSVRVEGGGRGSLDARFGAHGGERVRGQVILGREGGELMNVLFPMRLTLRSHGSVDLGRHFELWLLLNVVKEVRVRVRLDV